MAQRPSRAGDSLAVDLGQSDAPPALGEEERRKSVMSDYKPDWSDDELEFDEDEEAPEDKLSSDLTQDETLSLLRELQSEHPALYGEYTTKELRFLVEHYMSVLTLQKDEPVIGKGEEASFMGIVLRGSFQCIAESYDFTVDKGVIFGTKEYYTGGQRTMDIKARETSVVAVLTFKDIDLVSKLHPELVLKLNRMLTMGVIVQMQASIEFHKEAAKQHSQSEHQVTRMKSALMFQNAVRKSINITQHRKSAIEQLQSRHMSPAGKESKSNLEKPSATVSGKGKDAVASHKQEVLFRSRLQAVKREHEKEIQTEEEKRKQAEKKARTHRYKVANRERVIKKQKVILERLTKENQDLKDYRTQASRELEEDSKLISDLFAQRERSKKTIEELKGHIDTLTQDFEQQKQEIMDVSRKKESTKLAEMRQQLLATRSQLNKVREKHLGALNEHRVRDEALNERLAKEKARRKSAQKHVDSFKLTLAKLERTFDEHEERYVRDTKQGIIDPESMKKLMKEMKKVVNSSIGDPDLREHALALMKYREKLHQAHRALQKTTLEVQSLTAQVNRHRTMHTISKRELMVARDRLKKQVAESFMAPKEVSMSTQHYAKLLQRLCVGNFVHHWKTRKTLKTVQAELLTVAMDMLSGMAADSQTDFNFYHGMKSSMIRQRELLLSGRYSGKHRGLSLIDQMKELVSSLHFVAQKLRDVFRHLSDQTHSLREDSNAMLTRNIELKMEMRDLDMEYKDKEEQLRAEELKVAEREKEIERLNRILEGGVVTSHYKSSSRSARPPRVLVQHASSSSQAAPPKRHSATDNSRSSGKRDVRLPPVAAQTDEDNVAADEDGKATPTTDERNGTVGTATPHPPVSPGRRIKSSGIHVEQGQEELQQLKERLHDLEELNRFLYQTAQAQRQVATSSVGLGYTPTGKAGAHSVAVLPLPLRASKTHPYSQGRGPSLSQDTVNIYSARAPGHTARRKKGAKSRTKRSKGSKGHSAAPSPAPPSGKASAAPSPRKATGNVQK